MDRVLAADVIATHLLRNLDHRPDLLTSAEAPRPVDIRKRTWDLWLRDGGRPDTPSYVGPLEPARVGAARDALRTLSPRDAMRRGPDHEIGRDALVALANRAAKSNERRCVALWVATMMWGGGTVDTRSPWRTAQGLASDDLGELLVASHRDLRNGDLEGAYRTASALHGSGEPAITRWLWAASLGLPDLDIAPVILDTNIRTTLGRLDISPRRSPVGYVDYADTIGLATAALRDDFGFVHASPEKVAWLLAKDGT